MGGRVVEGTGLENRQASMRLVGSNPTPSAIPGPRGTFNSVVRDCLPMKEVGLLSQRDQLPLAGAALWARCPHVPDQPG